MTEIGTDLKKEEIALSKGYMRWYRVIENEVRLFVNEEAVNKDGQIINKIFYKDNRAELCVDNFSYAEKFYNKHKHLNARLFVKPNAKSLYTEYKVKQWNLSDKGIVVLLS